MLIEVLLTLAAAVAWLWPAVVALRRDEVLLGDPRLVFGPYIVLTTLVALSEHWIGWTARGIGRNGIRLQTQLLADDPEFFTRPLILLAIAGVFFSGGLLFSLRRLPLLAKGKDSLAHAPAIRGMGATPPLVVFVIASVVLHLPFLVLGEGSGFFWTVPLLYVTNFLPALLLLQDRRAGLLLALLLLPLVGLRGSKGDFIYFLLPLVFVLVGRHEGRLGRAADSRRIRRFVLSTFVLTVALGIAFAGTWRQIEARGEIGDQGASPTSVVLSAGLEREYAFEVFAALSHERSSQDFWDEPSWIWREMVELAPGSLVSKPLEGPSQVVATRFLPLDAAQLPSAGFYRHLLFAPYHDFGFVGMALSMMIVGSGLGWLYQRAVRAAGRRSSAWPIAVWLPVVVYVQLVANGAVAFAVAHIAIASGILFSLIALLKVVSSSSEAASSSGVGAAADS